METARNLAAHGAQVVEFDRRHKANGVRATAVHPGGIQTEVGRHLSPEAIKQLVDGINAANSRPCLQLETIPQGAATTVWSGIVVSADEVGGLYCEAATWRNSLTV